MPDTSTSFGAGAVHHARGDVHGQPAEVAVHHLELAGVEAGAHLQPERAHRLGHGGGAADRPRGAVERGQEAVARALDLPAAVALERLPEERVVALEQEAPAAVAHLGGALVESQMSVNSTVASIRSGSRSWRVPVRNSSISPEQASESPIENMLSPPSSST